MSEYQATVKITIPADDDGMVGCRCPQETCRPRYFKIASSSPKVTSSSSDAPDAVVGADMQAPLLEIEDEQEDESHEEADAGENEHVLHCPYCGHTADRQQFFTPEQLEYAKSIIMRHITNQFQQEFKQLERRPDPHAFLSFGITVQFGALPAIATYEENRLKQHVVCPHCQAVFAVYGISFTCPHCGGDTLLWHLDSTAQEIRVFLDIPEDILARLDARSQEKLVENALKDVISFWEGYLKALYRQAIHQRYDAEKAAQLEGKMGMTFQRVPGSTERFAKDLGIDLLAEVTPGDIEMLTRVFNKRHVLTHNLGLADEKFLAQTQLDQRVGQEIEVTREETMHALEIVRQVLKRADEQTRPAR